MLKITIKISDTPRTYYTFLENDNAVEGVALNRRLDSGLESLCGEVESGELNITFSNLFNEFNPQVPTAPYKDIKNGQEVKVYSVANNIETTVFTGYIVDFKAPTTSQNQTCKVRAVDRLHLLLNSDTKTVSLQVENSMTLTNYLKLLFAAYGLSQADYDIEADLLDISFDYSLIAGNSLAEQLNEICKAADCYIFCGRTGRVFVKSRALTGIPVAELSRSSNTYYLTDSEYGYSIFNSYNSLKIGYTVPKLSEVKEILTIDNQAVQSGDNTISNLELGISNLYELDAIKITSSSDTRVKSLSATASTISLVLTNPTEQDDIIQISIYGKTIETAKAFITKPMNSDLEQSLEIDSILSQSKEDATTLAERLYNRALVDIPYVKANIECTDFPIDLHYIVRVNDSDVGLNYVGYVHSIDIEYDGNGYCLIELGIKAIYEEEEDE